MKLLVTGITLLGGVFAAFACVLLALRNEPGAFVLIVLAMALDMVDGPIARKTGATSKLGGTLDSCADVLIYLLFPVIYWAASYGLPIWVLVLFVAAGVFRLVRFTLGGFGEDKGKLFYAGMPVFYSQFLLLFTFAIRFDSLLLGALLLVVSALMVSTIPFAKISVRALATGLVIYIVVIALGLSHAL